MMLPSQVLVLDPVCLWPGWRAAPVQWDMRGSFVSAAPLGTGERHQASGPTAPACLALAMGTARHVSQRRVRRADKTGSSKRAVVLSGFDDEAKPCPSLFQVHAIAGITQQGTTVRSAVMAIMEMRQWARPQTASPAHAQAARAVPSCPARRRLCAPAARLALQVRSYMKSLFFYTPCACGNVSLVSSGALTHSEQH